MPTLMSFAESMCEMNDLLFFNLNVKHLLTESDFIREMLTRAR